jgi:hypothetical protein
MIAAQASAFDAHQVRAVSQPAAGLKISPLILVNP